MSGGRNGVIQPCMLMIDDDMSHVREELSLQVYQNMGIQPPQQHVYQCIGPTNNVRKLQGWSVA
jgi:hypothetical protein